MFREFRFLILFFFQIRLAIRRIIFENLLQILGFQENRLNKMSKNLGNQTPSGWEVQDQQLKFQKQVPKFPLDQARP